MARERTTAAVEAERETAPTRVYADMLQLGNSIRAVTGESFPQLWERLVGDRLVADWERKAEQQREAIAARKVKKSA